MNRSDFYAYLRQSNVSLFGTSLSQRQVQGLEALLDVDADLPISHMAHVLAEAHHETGGGMYPVKETVFPHSKDKNPSDATVIARLDRAYSNGQLPWVKTPYWRGGYFGRGVIQLTHEYNYQKASALVSGDLVRSPSMALDLQVSAKIAVFGCATGLFTGKRLDQFDGPEFDHYNARAIVNGDKKLYGDKIAKSARQFEKALGAAEWGDTPARKPIYHPDPQEQPSGFVSAILALLRSIIEALKGRS